MFRIAICDDETVLCSQLEKVILDCQSQFSDVISVEVFGSGEDMLFFLEENEAFDLIFLDIEMQCINGVEAGIRIRNELHHEMTQIVYISGKDNYYRELFQVRPLNFLDKPISAGDVIAQMNEAAKLLGKGKKIFTFQKERGVYRRYAGDILYLEVCGVSGRQIKLVTSHESIHFYGKLKEIHEELMDSHFYYCHKSFLFNYHHVIDIYTAQIKMSNGDLIPVSRNRQKEVLRIHMQMMENMQMKQPM